jgi:uncharacterized protein
MINIAVKLINMSAHILINNEAEQQLEFQLQSGEKAFVTYRYWGKIIVLMHTEVPQSEEGKGLGSELARQTFEWIRAQKLMAKVFCPFLVVYLKRHPEFLDVVTTEELK